MGFGDVLLHFIEAVGGDGHQRVVLTVHDLLLEGVEGFVHSHGNRVRAPSTVHADHDRVVGGTDLDRGEFGQRADGLLAVGDEAEALRMPRDGDGAAFGFHALVDEIPVLIDAVVEFLDALEDVGKVERAEGGGEDRGVVHREHGHLEDALLHVLEAALLTADLPGGELLDLDTVSAELLDQLVAHLRDERMIGVHVRRRVAVRETDDDLVRRVRGGRRGPDQAGADKGQKGEKTFAHMKLSGLRVAPSCSERNNPAD